MNDTFAARELISQQRERVPQEAGLLGFIEGVLPARTIDVMPFARKHVKHHLRDRVVF